MNVRGSKTFMFRKTNVRFSFSDYLTFRGAVAKARRSGVKVSLLRNASTLKLSYRRVLAFSYDREPVIIFRDTVEALRK